MWPGRILSKWRFTLEKAGFSMALDRTNLQTPGAKVKPDIEQLFDAVDGLLSGSGGEDLPPEGGQVNFIPPQLGSNYDFIHVAALDLNLSPSDDGSGVYDTFVASFPTAPVLDRYLVGFYYGSTLDADIKNMVEQGYGALKGSVQFPCFGGGQGRKRFPYRDMIIPSESPGNSADLGGLNFLVVDQVPGNTFRLLSASADVASKERYGQSNSIFNGSHFGKYRRADLPVLLGHQSGPFSWWGCEEIKVDLDQCWVVDNNGLVEIHLTTINFMDSSWSTTHHLKLALYC